MKNLLKLSLVTLFLFAVTSTYAQKFGHIDTQQLVQIMPSMKSAQKTLEAYAKDLQEVQGQMEKELQTKWVEYSQKKDSLSDVKLKALEADIQNLQQRAQTNGQVAQQNMQKKQAELMKPIIEKMRSTIETVAKEKGLIYVFDVQPGTPILYKSNESIDLLPLVKQKLGIQ